MKIFRRIRSGFSVIGRYRFRWVLTIAMSWTLIDLVWIRYFHLSLNDNSDPFRFASVKTVLLRGSIVFFTSYIMASILFFKARTAFRNMSLLATLLAKTAIFLLMALFMNFLLHFTYLVFISHLSFSRTFDIFLKHASSAVWLLHHSMGWVVLFLFTQLGMEFYEKYSPGVFWAILVGRYIQPKVEKRIVMFLDLTDSTPIAEQLENKEYFSFLRDFIYFISIAMLEYEGRVYQYIGDEIVVTWKHTPDNIIKCLDGVAVSSRLLQKNSNYFQKRYGVVPKFSSGVHAGEVTVGEIGIIKKDIVMSGDTMNTASRICDYGKTLDTKCVISKEFLIDTIVGWGIESLGAVDLKGKNESIELCSVKL